jgi:3',5'-cyclic AMP phosphodiesterase CpdA
MAIYPGLTLERPMREAAVALLVAVLLLSQAALSQPALPGVPALFQRAVTPDIGLGKPAVVKPGGSFQFTLPGFSVSQGYIYTVVLEGGKLRLLNYTVPVSVSGQQVTVAVPSEVRPALYDLVLAGQGRVEVPRSVWVIDPSASKLRIVHISDQHYGAGQPDVITGDRNRFSGYIVASLLSPDLIIDTGDVADTASEQQYRWAYAYERAFLYSFPVFSIPGNHDTPPDAYTGYYGSPWWYRLIGDRLLVIGLYSYEQGYVPLEQLRWAEEVLRKHASVPVKIILVHHPVFYYQGELKTTYDDEKVIYPYDPQKSPGSPIYSTWSGNMEATRYFLRLVEEYGVNFVFSGHVHRDLYVKYTSTRTGRTTYFVTTTTLGMGSAIYDGLGLYAIDLGTGAIDFPVKPKSFIGFANESRRLAQNSIPVGTYPPANSLGVANQVFVPAALYQSEHAYVITLENKLDYLQLENSVVWCLPWSGNLTVKVEQSGGAEFTVLDQLRVGDKLFLGVRIRLPPQGKLTVILANAPDLEAPKVTVGMVSPEKPAPGSTFTALVEVEDRGWGLASFSASMLAGGAETPVEAQLYLPGTLADPVGKYVYKLTAKVPSGTSEVKLVFTAVDFAGRVTRQEYELPLALPEGKPSAEQKPSTAQETPQPQPSPPQPPAQPPETKPAPAAPPVEQAPPGVITLIIFALLVVTVALLLVAALRRGSRGPSAADRTR